jgi:hypothetical protein
MSRERGNMLNKKWKILNPKLNKSKYLNPKQTLSSKTAQAFFSKGSCEAKKFVLNIWILVFAIVWYLGFRVWNLSPRDIEQIREGGCRVAWTILRRSGRRDLSSNLSNPIFVYLKKD